MTDMGNYETILELGAGMTPTLSGRFFVVAREAEMAALQDGAAIPGFTAASFVALPADAPLPEQIVRSAQVLVLEVDAADPQSLRRVAQVRSDRPDLPIIAALNQADVSLVRALIRQGVADVASLPFAREELAAQIFDQLSKVAELTLPGDLSPMFSIVRSTGGCGATTVVTHLAAALAASDTSGRGVCVVDLELQNGDVAAFVGEVPQVTISALLEAGERLDIDLLRSTITETRFGFSVMAAPDVITPLDTMDVDQLLRILRLLRRQFAYVLIDLPAAWTNWALSVALASSRVLLISDLSISSLRQAKRRLELLSSVGIGRDSVSVVVNRVERRLFKTIGVEEVGEALGCEVLASLALENDLRSAQDQGLLITSVTSRSRFAGDIRALAAKLSG